MIKKSVISVFRIVTIILISSAFIEIVAQCPMCRIAAESNLENGGSEGAGLNRGILYMLALPYLLVSIIGFIWWRKSRRMKEEQIEEQIREVLG